MKKLLLIIACFIIGGCAKLDLNPLSEGSSENWYKDETEITLSLNDLYREYLWELDANYTGERMTDNWAQRQASNAYSSAAINSEWATAQDLWLNTYKGITRANTILNSLDNAKGSVADATLKRFAGEAHFMRAAFYARLIFYYGDVPYYTETLSIDQAFKLGRVSKATILQSVYDEFDKAIDALPVSYPASGLKRVTKGAALAFKARTALYMGDWAVARDAAKACMDLKAYTLYPNYGEYFLSKTRNVSETIFAIPRSAVLGSTWATANFFPRTPGGSAVAQPSWDVFCAYTCTDGLPIDESPLFDPRNPFKNRDPRLKASIVEFGTENLGVIYDPNPYSTTVLNVATGKMVSNKDTRSVDIFASYNGLSLKKGVDADWVDDKKADFDIIVMRYAEVLLTYAEAMAELNTIDASALNAINQVRARAYGVAVTATGSYPAVSTTDQARFRSILRNERRVEFLWENRRLDDLIRWRLAEKALTRPSYGLLDPNELKTKVIDKKLWFFPTVPQIDNDGLADFSAMNSTGLIKLLVVRDFDKNRQYLFPIPSKEIQINTNLTQNPGY